MRIAALAVSVALVGCPAPERTVAPTPPATVEVVAAADGVWVARYHAPRPIAELHFVRAGAEFRAASWPSRTAGYAYSSDGVLMGSPAATTVDVQLTVVSSVSARAWPPVLEFSDGGIAVFGGYLVARDGSGRDFQGVASEDYLYRGPLQPQVVGNLRVHLDPTLPLWMAEVAARRLPEVMAYYAAGTGLAPPAVVQVMITFNASGELELNGATTPGSLVVAVTGADWQQGNPWQVERFVRFLAHEVAHLWNAGIARFDPDAPAWLHEGAAEAFADRALRELGLVDEARFLELDAAAQARCASGGARADYDCGNVHATAAERGALVTGDTDLFGLWGELLRTSIAAGRRYDAADWCALLARHDAAVSPCRADTGVHPAAGTEY